MTREEAIKMLKSRDVHGNMTGYTGGQSDVLDLCLKSLEALSEIDSIIHDTGRIQEDVFRYKMICDVISEVKE